MNMIRLIIRMNGIQYYFIKVVVVYGVYADLPN
jgi:hypothetical protein